MTRPIVAMCPQRVCTVCGQPSRRLIEHDPETLALNASKRGESHSDDRSGDGDGMYQKAHFASRNVVTTGWSDCGHGSYRAGVVFDPFAGSGTTLSVATGHGRDAIGCDIDARNADLALERVGPLFLTVEHHSKETAA